MDDLVKQLMHATVSIDGDFDVGCNVRDAAVERLERSEAATAAAYEVVSKQLAASRETFCYASPGSDEEFTSLLLGFDTAAGAIRALATPDQTAALERLIAEAEARVWEKAADIARHAVEVTGHRMREAKEKKNKKEERDWQSMLFCAVDIRTAILAASKKGGQ